MKKQRIHIQRKDNDNPIPIDSKIDPNCTFWQKIYIHLLLEKSNYNMYLTTRSRFKCKGDISCLQTGETHTFMYLDNDGDYMVYRSHARSYSSITSYPFEWWVSKLLAKEVVWPEDTFLDYQIQKL